MLAWVSAATDACSHGDLAGLTSLILVARGKAEKLEGDSRRAGFLKWRQWLTGTDTLPGDGPACPRRGAFLWVRGLAGWTRSPVGAAEANDSFPDEPAPFDDVDIGNSSPDIARHHGIWMPRSGTLLPLCDQADIELEADSWAALWKEGSVYRSGIEPNDACPELDTLTATSIRIAASTFPLSTGLGCDNTAPRALCRLSDDLLDALGRVFKACERAGVWGEVIKLVMIVLLDKPDGGRRPIGLFPTIVRVWMRARALIARKWESDHFRPGIFGSAGMGAQRAAWQVAFQGQPLRPSLAGPGQSV
jgi:hypothetical protein